MKYRGGGVFGLLPYVNLYSLSHGSLSSRQIITAQNVFKCCLFVCMCAHLVCVCMLCVYVFACVIVCVCVCFSVFVGICMCICAFGVCLWEFACVCFSSHTSL